MKSGIVPIGEKFLQPNFLGALEFREGFVFFRVIRRRICRYKPYPLVDSTGSSIVIPPQMYRGEYGLIDPRNPSKDVIYLDTSKSPDGLPWFYHGSIGIKPQFINLYIRVPQGKEIPGRFPNLDPIRPTAGDNFGYIDSSVSPYEEPTDYVELVIPPRVKIGAEFYNKDPSRSFQPVLNIEFSLYMVQFFDVDKDRRIISDIASRKVPAAFLTVGVGDVPLELGTMLKNEWNVEPISLEELLKG